MTPFVLLGRKELPCESGPSDEEAYDQHRQLWINKKSGAPLVTSIRTHVRSSKFGETTLTETREGADRTDVVAINASRFGETTLTRAPEGADKVEGAAIEGSRFGETSMSKTSEGPADQEGAHAAYSHF